MVYFGFVRGLEPVTYVAYILERYRDYLRSVRYPGEAAVGGLTGRSRVPIVRGPRFGGGETP